MTHTVAIICVIFGPLLLVAAIRVGVERQEVRPAVLK